MTEKEITAIVPRSVEVDSLVPDAENITKVAKALLAAGMWPHFKNEAQVFCAVEYGRELGFPPIIAMNIIFPVAGKLSLMADGLLALANKRAGVTWEIVESTDKGCTMIFSRPGFKDRKVRFDESDAAKAGLLTKTNYKTYPTDQYVARAKSRGVRQIAGDVLTGLYSIEEMSDVIMPAEGDIKELPGQVKAELPTEVTPALPAEEKPSHRKQAEKPKKAAEVTPQEKAESPLDEVKAEIISLFEVLTQKYIRAPEALLEAIHARLQQVYHVSRAKIPDDLNEKEAITVRNALRNTLEAEQKEEEEKEKGL